MAKLYKTPIQTIRDKCLDCCSYQPKEVRLCPALGCSNWAYRMGKRPSKETLKTLEDYYSKNPKPSEDS